MKTTTIWFRCLTILSKLQSFDNYPVFYFKFKLIDQLSYGVITHIKNRNEKTAVMLQI